MLATPRKCPRGRRSPAPESAAGASTITVTATDDGGTARGGSDTSVRSVQVMVRPVNDAPVAADDELSAIEDTPLDIAAPGVLDNDADLAQQRGEEAAEIGACPAAGEQ